MRHYTSTTQLIAESGQMMNNGVLGVWKLVDGGGKVLPDAEYILTLKVSYALPAEVSAREYIFTREVIIDNYDDPVNFNITRLYMNDTTPVEEKAMVSIGTTLHLVVQAENKLDERTRGKIFVEAKNLPPGAYFGSIFGQYVLYWKPQAKNPRQQGRYKVTFLAKVNDNEVVARKELEIFTVFVKQSLLKQRGTFSDYLIYRDKIFWAGEGKFSLYDINSGAIEELISGGASLMAVWEDMLYWVDPQKKGIQRFNFKNKVELPAINAEIAPGMRSLSVYANMLAWDGEINADGKSKKIMYLYDLRQNKEVWPQPAEGESQDLPVVDKDRVAFRSAELDEKILKVYNLKQKDTQEAIRGDFYYFTLQNDHIAWQQHEKISQKPGLYVHNLKTKETRCIDDYAYHPYLSLNAGRLISNVRYTDLGEQFYLYDFSLNQRVWLNPDYYEYYSEYMEQFWGKFWSYNYFPRIYGDYLVWYKHWNKNAKELPGGAKPDGLYFGRIIYAPLVISAFANRSNLVTINGQYFGPKFAAEDRVSIAGIPATLKYWSETKIICILPPSAQTGSLLKVAAEGGPSNEVSLIVDSLPPRITHTPPAGVSSRKPIELTATITDTPSGVKQAVLAIIHYYIAAQDHAGNWKSTPEYRLEVR